MIAALASVLLVGLPAQQARFETIEFQQDGMTRFATLYKPANVRAGCPVVFVFHGHGGNARQARRAFPVHELWPEAAVIYGQGVPTVGRTDLKGERNGWQKNIAELGNRDLKYFDTVWAEVKKRVTIEPRRVFAMGHSNGGRFTYLVWSQRGDLFAGFSPSATPIQGLEKGMPRKPAFVVAGKKDELVPFYRQEQSIGILRQRLSVGANPKVDGLISTYTAKDGIELCTYIYDGPHKYPDAAFGPTIEFFKRIKPVPSSVSSERS